MTKAGTRVGAILKADQKTVWLLGYGTYEGDHEPPCGPMGISIEEYKRGQRILGKAPPPFLNPRIRLDDGRVVWGLQCWWGPADQIRAKIGDRTIETVTDDIEQELTSN